MATTTPNYGWTVPTSTDLVKDGATAIETLGDAVDATVFANANAAIAKTIVDAKGDLIAATGSDAVARLAVGTNGQVLTVDSTTATGLKYATVAADSMTELATGSLSGAVITLSSISQGYKDLYLVINGYKVSNSTSTPYLGLNAVAVSDIYGIAWSPNTTGANVYSGIRLSGDRTVFTGDFDNNAYAYFFNYTTAGRKAFNAGGTYYDGSAESYYFGAYSGGNRTAGAITEINIRLNSTFTYTAGTYILYGVK
jgi:hypothetical protein